jgi:hypothetical protein
MPEVTPAALYAATKPAIADIAGPCSASGSTGAGRGLPKRINAVRLAVLDLSRLRPRCSSTQKSIAATFDSDIEIITPDLQKIQFTSSKKIKLNRPDKLRIRRTGG